MGQARERILIVRLSAIGDVVFALPTLELLKRERPEAQIDWVVEDRAAALLEASPHIDELIVMPRRDWRRMRREGASRLEVLRAMRSWGRELAARDYDVALDLQGNIKSGLVTRASAAKRKIGLARRLTREPNWLFTTERVDPGSERVHAVERGLALLEPLGIEPDFVRPRLEFSAVDRQGVEAFLETLPPEKPRVVLNPGTSNWFKSKRWSVASWASLADSLVREQGAGVIVNWGPDELDVVDALLARTTGTIHRGPDLPDMRQVACLMQSADLVIGCDTGPVHLAATLGTPTLVLFGPYDPRVLHPYGHPERGLSAQVSCSPCRWRDCPDLDCMKAIRPDEVLQMAASLLAETGV